ncbi:MAG: AEC family transporter, partial [Acutalibacteraceae bacterium]
MLDNFLTVGEQVIILFILIMVGFVLGKTNLIGEKGAKTMTNVVLYAVTPCVIIESFQRPFDFSLLKNLIIMTVCALGIHIFSIIVATLCFREKEIARKSVFIVATVFSNCGFMSLPLQKALLGADGVFYGAIFIAVFNIFVWTYGIVIMSGSVKDFTVKKIIFNPGVLGVIVAVILWVLGV